MLKPSIQNLTTYNELITSLITLRLILKDTDKEPRSLHEDYMRST